jgi:hypothetical protein
VLKQPIDWIYYLKTFPGNIPTNLILESEVIETIEDNVIEHRVDFHDVLMELKKKNTPASQLNTQIPDLQLSDVNAETDLARIYSINSVDIVEHFTLVNVPETVFVTESLQSINVMYPQDLISGI